MTLKVLITLALAGSLGIAASAKTPMPVGTLTAARNLAAQGTKTGYIITGQLRSTNGCMDVRFSPVRMPDGYDADQYRRPGTEHKMCTEIVTWKPAKLSVKSQRHPAFIVIRSVGHESGQRVRVKPWM